MYEIVVIMQEIRLDGFKDAVDSAKNVVITNHTNPDGDAMGSALALKRVLEKLDKSVSVIVPNPYPEFLWHLSGNAEDDLFRGEISGKC